MIDLRYPTALQIVLSLAVARESGQRCTSGELAEGLGANPVLVRKLLVPLVQRGIVASSIGKNGGVWLARPADEVTLLEVYQASVDDRRLFTVRPNVPPRCVVSRNIDWFVDGLTREAEAQLASLLAGKTIAQALQEMRARDSS
ncbi:Rrf2 family transcriptional regulator [Brucella pseudogrignonensis]|uniref:RrF2 family transcriptional regulator n=1 Tax=Brucella pseudogrignonensis TaxID=419475 RepID=UPI001EDA528B|nr:Rrf2 family transcriptional regulator [Brucella pseudogrignonensis]UKK94700.1 Rrf2 family transcriptional regulator [Brucella pseudogrignonensis]